MHASAHFESHAGSPLPTTAAAWSDAQALKLYDNGNSKTNTLYWIATRPADGGGPPSSPTPPALARLGAGHAHAAAKPADAGAPAGAPPPNAWLWSNLSVIIGGACVAAVALFVAAAVRRHVSSSRKAALAAPEEGSRYQLLGGAPEA